MPAYRCCIRSRRRINLLRLATDGAGAHTTSFGRAIHTRSSQIPSTFALTFAPILLRRLLVCGETMNVFLSAHIYWSASYTLSISSYNFLTTSAWSNLVFSFLISFLRCYLQKSRIAHAQRLMPTPRLSFESSQSSVIYAAPGSGGVGGSQVLFCDARCLQHLRLSVDNMVQPPPHGTRGAQGTYVFGSLRVLPTTVGRRSSLSFSTRCMRHSYVSTAIGKPAEDGTPSRASRTSCWFRRSPVPLHPPV